jgi:transcriptional regulator with XRE-family HTH domain
MTHQNRKLIEARTSRNISQTELAKQIGVSQQLLSLYEAGNCMPKVGVLESIARALNVPPWEIDPSVLVLIPTPLRPVVQRWNELNRAQRDCILKSIREVLHEND